MAEECTQGSRDDVVCVREIGTSQINKSMLEAGEHGVIDSEGAVIDEMGVAVGYTNAQGR